MRMTPFLKPRLCGERFEGASIPLEVLRDFAALEGLVVEVAKWKFLQDHPERQRMPKGFTDGVCLRLSAVSPGSAVLAIDLQEEDDLPLFAAESARAQEGGQAGDELGAPSVRRQYYEQAREAIVAAIGAAERDDAALDGRLPGSALRCFDRFGRSLRAGEAIELAVNSCPVPARLTPRSRRRLLLASPQVQEVTEEVCLRGAVPEADQHDRTFELQLSGGPKVKVPLPEQHFETIMAAFQGYRDGARILVRGIARFNRQNRLLGFESIDEMALLDPLDVPARLDEFRGLRDGWFEGEGRAPDAAGLDWLSHAFDRYYPEELPLPHVYPTAEGGVLAEWSLGGHELSLEIDLATRRAEWHDLELATQVEDASSLDLSTPVAWQALASLIRGREGGA